MDSMFIVYVVTEIILKLDSGSQIMAYLVYQLAILTNQSVVWLTLVKNNQLFITYSFLDHDLQFVICLPSHYIHQNGR